MENKSLYDKYNQGRHWKNHPTIYAERFADFLLKKGFGGSLVDLGCGNGRDAEVFVDKGISVIRPKLWLRLGGF